MGDGEETYKRIAGWIPNAVERLNARDEMTNKEAAWHLGTYSTTMGSGQTTDDQHNEAKRIAIKALKQEPCKDCISRQDLLKKRVYAPIAPVIKGESVHYEDIVFARDIINAEPIQQEPKTGHWIVVPGMNEQCSKCGKFFPLSYFKGRPFEINYCPNCGAKMSEIPTGSESEG